MRRVIPIYRNDAGHSAEAAFDPEKPLTVLTHGRSIDVAYDTVDADTGELVRRGKTPREEIAESKQIELDSV